MSDTEQDNTRERAALTRLAELRRARGWPVNADEIEHDREVRPLTAAQVEELAEVIKRQSLEVRGYQASWVDAARAALAHLGIPTEQEIAS